MLFTFQGTCEPHFYMLFPWFGHSPLNIYFLKHSWRKRRKILKEGCWFLCITLEKMQILFLKIFFNFYNWAVVKIVLFVQNHYILLEADSVAGRAPQLLHHHLLVTVGCVSYCKGVQDGSSPWSSRVPIIQSSVVFLCSAEKLFHAYIMHVLMFLNSNPGPLGVNGIIPINFNSTRSAV